MEREWAWDDARREAAGLTRVFRSTEELVQRARLEEIERAHRSSGALLDHRELHPLEDISTRKTPAHVVTMNRINTRRGARADGDIANKADQAIAAIQQSGMDIGQASGEYELEFKLWRNKATRIAYTEQRKFRRPELEAFAQSLSGEARVEFQRRVGERLRLMADRLRAECREEKIKMDLQGVFHPDANAHRTQALYVSRLYKALRCEALEDVVLRKMQAEMKHRVETEEFRALQRQQLMDSLLNSEDGKNPAGGSNNPGAEAIAALLAPDETAVIREEDDEWLLASQKKVVGAGTLGRMTRSVKLRHEEAEKSRKIVSDNKKYTLKERARSLPHLSTSSKSNSKLRPLSSQQGESLKVQEEALSINDVHNKKNALSCNSHISNGSAQSISCSTPGGSIAGTTTNTPSKKLFGRRLKHERLGYLDHQSVLADETSRLESAEVATFSKPRDRSEVLEEKFSQWMLAEVQSQQVSRTAAGALAPPTKLSSNAVVTAGRLDGNGLSTLIDIHTTQPRSAFGLASAGSLSPQKIMPFDEFANIMQAYRREELAEEDEISAPPRGNSVGQLAGFNSDDDTILTPTGSPKAGNFSPGSKHLIPHGDKEHNNSISTAQPSISGTNHTLSHKTLMRQMAETDPGFNNFLKVREKEQPSTRFLKKIHIKPRLPRKVAPLGSDNVDSTAAKSSFMSKTKNSIKPGVGFINHFASTTSTTLIEQSESPDDKNIVDRLYATSSGGDSPSDNINTSNETLTNKQSLARAQAQAVNLIIRRSQQFIAREFSPNFFGVEPIFTFPPDIEYDMQAKLTTTWEVLRLSMEARFLFISKYSTFAYATEMSRAIDQWSEVATLLVLLRDTCEFLARVQRGNVLYPLRLGEVMRRCTSKIPPLMAVPTGNLVPLAIVDTGGAVNTSVSKTLLPLSVQALLRYRDSLRRAIEQKAEAQLTISSADLAEQVLRQVLELLSVDVLGCVERCRTDFDDTITMDGTGAREWILSIPIVHEFISRTPTFAKLSGKK